jgi:hypothetical protein
VRGGGCSFVLSSFLRKLDKAMREQGGGAMWQIISQGDPGAKGYVKQVTPYPPLCSDECALGLCQAGQVCPPCPPLCALLLECVL